MTGETTGGLTEQQMQMLGQRGLQNELSLQHNSLRTLAEETGGIAVINTNSFDNTFSRIVQDNSSYYVLAYYPPNPKRDGKFHNIQVRVNRPGLTVRARRGYANPSGKVVEPVANPASKLTPGGTRGARQPAAGERPDHAGVRGAVQGHGAEGLGAARRRDARQGSAARRRRQGAALVLRGGREGQVPRGGSNDPVTLNLRPETKATIERTGMRTLSRLELPPGRYQLRVIANDLSTKAVGSVLYDLDVPDFTKGPITMSGVALTSAASSRVPTVRPDEELRQVLPAPPMGSRIFPVGDELALFAEIYDNAGGSPHKVDITTTVTADEGKVMFKADDVRDSSELQGKSGGYGYSTRVPLEGDAGAVCAEGRGAVASRSGTDDQSPGAVPDRGAHEPGVQVNEMIAMSALLLSVLLQVVVPPLRSVEKGAESMVEAQRQVTVRDGAEWTSLWHAHSWDRPEPRDRLLPRDGRRRVHGHAADGRLRRRDRRLPRLGQRRHRAVPGDDAGSRYHHGADPRLAVPSRRHSPADRGGDVRKRKS